MKFSQLAFFLGVFACAQLSVADRLRYDAIGRNAVGKQHSSSVFNRDLEKEGGDAKEGEGEGEGEKETADEKNNETGTEKDNDNETGDEKDSVTGDKKDNETGDEKDNENTHNWTRTLVSCAVGLFYFGPAAHAWYEWIFKVLPGTSLISTLQKAALGQIIFGPSFTCVFFATSLMQSGSFTLGNWFKKIKNDLPQAFISGAGFWPLVDLVSYSLIPIKFIPLFINMCSFVWTIYLSVIANKK